MTRRWIIGKDRRICPRACQDYSTPTATVKISDPVDGMVHSKCRECGAEQTNQLHSFKDKRPCERCKIVHDVTVSFWHGAEHTVENENWKKQCSLCDLETSAAHHAQTARNFAARAAKLRAEQQRKAIKAQAGKSMKALVMSEIQRGAAPSITTNKTVKALLDAEKEDDVPHDFYPDAGPRDFGEND